MTIDPLTVAIVCIALVITNGGISFVATKLANGNKFCSEHSKLRGRLKRLEAEHEEDTLQDAIKNAVREAFIDANKTK